MSDTQSGFDDLADSIRSGLYLRRGLSGTEDLYYLSILITVTAYSEKGACLADTGAVQDVSGEGHGRSAMLF